jgi:hypothetical protein
MKLVYRILRKSLLKHFLAEQNKPTTHKDLSYAFTDNEGKKYFRFADGLTLPLERFNKLQEFQMWMSARLTGENLQKLIDKALEIIQEGIGKNKGAAKVSAILYQIKERQDKIVPHELVLNIIACQLVREDESPSTFNPAIHRQKVLKFKEDAELNNNFFLRLPELKTLYNLTTISQIDWTQYMEESMQENEIIKEALKIYS